MSTYTAIFERADDGAIWAFVPEIPEASGMGETVDEAEASLRAGLRIWIEAERERGGSIPPPSTIDARKIAIDVD